MMFKWLTLLIGFCYVILGIAILVYKFMFVALEPSVAYALGPLVMVYGIFRIWRGIVNLKNSQDDEE